jgi:hypothetical protein
MLSSLPTPAPAREKANCCLNATNFGIHAQSEIIRGEDPAELEALAESYMALWNPQMPEQLFQVKILIRTGWELDRLTVAATKLWLGFRRWTAKKRTPKTTKAKPRLLR